jgi:uncharacterized protein HemY
MGLAFNQLNIQVKAIDIQAGYDGSLNESYHKTSGLSLAGLVAFVVVLFGAVVVLFRVLRFVLAMVGVIARVVIRVKIDITNGFGIWLF